MKLSGIASIIRSKNAGPFYITLDILFSDKNSFEKFKNSNIWNRSYLAKLYGIKEENIKECIIYDLAMAFKCTFRREIPSGSFGDTDIYGAQQHIPLYNIEIE